MPLNLTRSQRVEDLVSALATAISDGPHGDPLAAVPIVVGSRGMERWLRHELATECGVAAGLEFLFPGAAFRGVSEWLLGDAALDAPQSFRALAATGRDAWSSPALTFRLLEAIRARREEVGFEHVRRYLELPDATAPAGVREVTFAGEVAAVLSRLLHDRPDDCLRWLRAGHLPGEEEHRWLAVLLKDLRAALPESPPERLERLAALPPRGTDVPLYVFGLSTMSAGDKRWLSALSRHLTVHLFLLAPSDEWWADIRNRPELRRVVRESADAAEVAEALRAMERDNVLLSASGAPSRDCQLWLEEVGYDERGSATSSAEKDPPTLLSRVQRWVGAAEEMSVGAPWKSERGCASLTVHACHGALRQVEVLRDELLRRFAEELPGSARLEPRHVLVMTPDLATYAPLVSAVFSRGLDGAASAPAIPVEIADLGLRATNPVAEVLLSLLTLGSERVTAPGLLALLERKPLCARFGIEEEDVPDLRELVREAGVRWGWDATDRARHGQPERDQNTVRFGLERLALGVLMPDEGGLDVVPHPEGVLGPAVPLDVANRDRVARFGRLAALCEAVEAASRELAAPATREEWRTRLGAQLDACTALEDDDLWQRLQVEDALDEVLGGADAAEAPVMLEREAVLALLRDAFEVSRRGDRHVKGAVTVCGLEPMRSVPFRVVAILGLDDGAFPRASTTAAWDPFSRRRHGEYDRRAVDRHLFLEALLCARDALLLLGTGFEPKRGKEVPMSIALTELSEVIAVGAGCEAEEVAVRHPLQPWSERAFSDPARAPFDATWASAATSMRAPARRRAGLLASAEDAPMPPDAERATSLRAEDLARSLAKPQKTFLHERLGVRLTSAEDGAEAPHREPLEYDGLDTWKLNEAVLRAVEAGTEGAPVRVAERFAAEGVALPGAKGAAVAHAASEVVQSVRANVEAIGGEPAPPMYDSVVVKGVTLTATATSVLALDDGLHLVATTASKQANEHTLLTAWISGLVFRAAGKPVVTTRVVGKEKESAETLSLSRTPEESLCLLDDLVALAQELRESPVPLFAKLSRMLVEKMAAGREKGSVEPLAELVEGLEGAWSSTSPKDRACLDDPYTNVLFGDRTITDLAADAPRLLEYAERLWGPVVAAKVATGSKVSAGSTKGPATPKPKGKKGAKS